MKLNHFNKIKSNYQTITNKKSNKKNPIWSSSTLVDMTLNYNNFIIRLEVCVLFYTSPWTGNKFCENDGIMLLAVG